MCVIVFCEKNVKPSMENVKKCWDENPHGAGLGVRNDNGDISFYKGLMTLDSLQQKIEEVEDFEEMIIHFRLASSGGISARLTHPFSYDIISTNIKNGKEQFLLFHNGHDWQLDQVARKYQLSDSAIAAILVQNEKNKDKILNKYSGKFAYMEPTKSKFVGYFFEVDGCQYSNTFWRTKRFVSNFNRSVWDKQTPTTGNNVLSKIYKGNGNGWTTHYMKTLYNKQCPECNLVNSNLNATYCTACNAELEYPICLNCHHCGALNVISSPIGINEGEEKCSLCKRYFHYKIDVSNSTARIEISNTIKKEKCELVCTKCKNKYDMNVFQCVCGNKTFDVVRTFEDGTPTETITNITKGERCDLCLRELDENGKCIVCD